MANLAPKTSLAQEFTWDPNPSIIGPQNGLGVWNTTSTNWWDFAAGANAAWINSTSSIANIGVVGGTTASQSVVTVASDIQLSQLNFRSVSTTTPASLHQYSMNGDVAGRILDFGVNGLIQVEDFASGGSQFIGLGANLRLKGENLKIQKFGAGTAFQFLTLSMTTNPELTGTFTLGGSIYAGFNPNAMPAIDRIVIEAGGSAAIGSGGLTFNTPFSLAGFGNSLTNSSTAYGAIRMTGSNSNYAGGILLTANAGVNTSSSGGTNATGITISGPITDGGNNFDFYRFAFGGEGSLILAAANTYGGATFLGRQVNNYTGSVTILDFAAPTAPAADILYHGLAQPGDVRFFGGNSPSVLRLAGAVGMENSQRLGALVVTGSHAALDVVAGEGGSMNVTTGAFSRENNLVSLNVTSTGAGKVITSGMVEGLVGPWMSYSGPYGLRSWAEIQPNGEVSSGYVGDALVRDGELLSNEAYGTAANLNLSIGSSGVINTGIGTTFANTLTMADWMVDRELALGAGQTFRLGATAGVQVVTGGRSLTIGSAGSGGALSAGGAIANTAGTLFLSNHSTSAALEVGANIVNNGTGVVTVVVNGAPNARTLLSGTNTHTGGTRVTGGILEVRSNGALGTSGTITVVEGSVASLALGGGVTVARPISIGGTGNGGLGALRSVDGSNTLTGAVTLLGHSLISADAGATLILSGATSSTNVVSGTFILTVGGAGTVNVGGRLNLTTGSLVKVGNGLLNLGGVQIYTGATTVSGGTLQFQPGHTSTTSGISVAAGASLSLNGVESNRPLTLNGNGFLGLGALYNNSETSAALTGTVALSVGVKVGGSGDISISNAGGITGNVTMTKAGDGTLTVSSAAASARTGVNMLEAGVLRLQGPTGLATVGTGAMALNGGVLSLGFDAAGTVGGVLNPLSDATVITDRATLGAGGHALTLGALAIGGQTLTVRAGSNVEIGTIGLTLGAAVIGGPSTIPGNPVFDVQSSAVATTVLTLGALNDQSIAPRTITFRNSGVTPSTVNLIAGATSLVNGTLVNLASATAPVTVNLNLASALGTLADVQVGAGNTLALGAAQTLASLAGTGTVQINNTSALTLTVGNANQSVLQNTQFSGVLSNGTGTLALIKTGKGTLTLDGAISNTYTGATTVSAGSLVLAKTNGAVAVGGNLTVGNSAASTAGLATARLEGSGQMLATASVAVNAGATLDLNGHDLTVGLLTSLLGGTITGTGNTITAAASGGTFTSNGVSHLYANYQMTGTVAATRTISVTSANDILTLHGRVTQGAFNGAITKTGTGTLVLLGDNDYGGLTTISTGMINIRHANALGLVTSGTSVAAGASLQIQGGITTSAEPLTLSGAGFAGVGGVGMQNGALVNVAGDNSFSGLLTLAAAATLSSDSGSLRLTNIGTISGAGFGLTLTGAGDGRLDSILGTTTGGVIKSGAGRWLLAGANTNTGTTTVIEGTLQLGDGTVGSWTSAPGLTFAGTGRFRYQGVTTGSSQSLGALTFQTGDGTVQSSYGGESGDTTLTFASLAPRIVGGTGNFVIDGGVNGASNKIVLTGQTPDSFLDQGQFFGGDSYAWVDAAGFVRGLDYASDAGAFTSGAGLTLSGAAHQQITGTITAQESAIFTTIKMAGDHALTLAEAQTLTVNGLLKTDGTLGGTIGGGTGLRAGLNAEMVIRVEEVADSLTLTTPVLANGANGLTKSGAGTLVLHSSNSYTGPTTVAAGTLKLTGGGTLATNLITVSSGGVLDLNGQAISNGVVINGMGTVGVSSLINSGGSTAQVGAITLASSATIGGAGDLVSRGALVGLSPIRLFKVGAGTVTFGDNAGVALPSLRTGANQIDEGTLRISNSSSALGTVAAQLILNGGRISLGSATSVVAYPTAVTANSAIEADVYVPGTGLVHTLGTLAIGNQTLTITAGSNITAEGTNAGVTFGLTTLRGNPTFDVQNPTAAVGATTTLTLGALNDQGNAKTITFTNNGSAATNSIVTLATAAGSLMQGTMVTVGAGANAGVTLNLNIAAALGTLAQVTLDEKSILNLGAAQTLGALTGNGTVSASGTFALTVGNANSSPTIDSEFTANLINGAGTLGFTKGGLGSLTLNPTIATYTGVTTVTGGILKLGNANALGLTSGVTIGVESTIDLNGLSTDRNFSSIRGVGFAGMGAIINSSETTSTITGTAVLASLTRIGGSGNITFNNQGGLIGNTLMTKAGSGTLTFRSVDTSSRSGVNQLDEGVLRLEAATGIRPVGAGVMALNGGTLSLGFDGSGSVGGAVNLLSDSTIIVDRMTEGGEDLVLSLGLLGIGANTLTVRAGSLVTSGSIGLTLGTTTIGGPALAPGNPVFDVQSSATAVMHLRLGALSDQAINPRTITFQNSGEESSLVTLGFAATSLVNGTMVNLANTGGPVRLNLDAANALGQWAQVTVASGNTLALGANQTLGGINGVGRVTASVPVTLTVGNALSSLPVDSLFEGVIEGGADLSLVKAGTGTLTLGGAESNTFAGAGGLVVAGGSLVLAKTAGAIAVPTDLTIGTVGNFNSTLVRLAGDHQIATTAKVVMNVGATLDVNGFSQSFGSLFGVAGSAIVNNASGIQQTVTFGVGNATGTVFAGSIADNTTGTGTLAVDKVGTGHLTLLGANRFSGPLNVTGGMLTFVNESNLGNGAVGNGINVDGATLNYEGTGLASLGLNQRLTVGAAGATVNVAESRGGVVFGGGVNPLSVGNLLKTGPGLLGLAGTTNLNGAALTVSEGVLRAGFGADGIGSITVGPTGVLDFSNGSAQALAGLTGLSLSGGSRLGFELDAASNDSLASLVAASVAGTIVLDFFSVGDGVSGMTYPLISAPSGLLGGNFVLGQGINGWNLAINSTDTLVSLVATKLQLLYWRGGQDASWSTLGAGSANWTLDQAGLVDAVQTPGFADTVVFSAASAPFTMGSEIITQLDAAFLVEGLIFDGLPETVTAVTINAGNDGVLTLKPLSATGGVEVRENAGLVKIAAPLIAGDAQVWRVANGGASLVMEGVVDFQHGVTKTGEGALTLSGENLGAGGLLLSQGRLNVNSPTALGSGTFTIGGGTVIDNTSAGPITLANNQPMVWSGAFSYGGTQALNLGGGAVRLTQDVTVHTVANSLTVGGVIEDGVGVFGLGKTGAGSLVLEGANTYRGATMLAEGTLILLADQQLVEATNTLILGATAGDTRAFTLDLNAASAVFGGEALVQTQNTVANSMVIGAGQSLTVRGGFAMGYFGLTETSTRLAISGAGAFNLGEVGAPTNQDVRIGNGGSVGVLNSSVLDLSGLAVFYAHLGQGATFSIGDLAPSGGSVGQVSQGSSVWLAPDSTVIAENLSVGGSALATQRLRLGSGSNTLFVDTLSISGAANDGASLLDFQGATGELLLRDLAGTGRAQWDVQNSSSASVGDLSGTVDLRGHVADLLVDVLAVGGRSAGTTGHGAGEFYFDTGVMDVTSVLLASRSGDSLTTSQVTANMTLGGGSAGSMVTLGSVNMSANSATSANSSGDAISTLTLTGAGSFNLGALSMGSLTVSGAEATSGTQATVNTSAASVTVGQITMAVNAASAALTGATTAASTLNVVEGTLNVVGDISMGGTFGNALNRVDNLIAIRSNGALVVGGHVTAMGGVGMNSMRILLDGGTLDMQGGSVGSALVPIQVSLESGTVRNLGQVNGGSGLTKTTGGTVMLEGVNQFDGLTVGAGALLFSAATLETEVVQVQGGAVLGGVGSLIGDLVLAGTLEEPAILRPGVEAITAGRELLAVQGALSLGAFSEVEFYLGQANFTALEVETMQLIDTTVRFRFALENGYVPAAGSSFKVLTWTAGGFDPLHNWAANLDLPGGGTILWDTADFISQGILRVEGLQLAPVVTAPPQSTTVNAGDATTFTVGITGSEVWLIEWLKDEVVIPGANGLSYSIANTAPDAAGVYQVRIVNEFGSVTSDGATLTVRTTPSLASQPQGAVVIGGTALTLEVAVLGPAPLTFVWKKDGVPVVGAPNTAVYVINPVSKVLHEGTYTVQVTNAFGSVESDPAVVVINNSPLITQQPVPTSVPEGNIATFQVVATGDGVLTYQWRRNGVALTEGGDFAGTTTPTLQVRAALMTAVASQYSVVVSGIGSPAISNAVALSFAPVTVVVEQDPAAQMVAVGAPIHLTVVTRGGLPQKFQWFRNGVRVAGATSASLAIPAATLGNAGAYSCVISNDLATGKSITTSAVAEVAVVDATARRFVIREGAASPTMVANAAGNGLGYAWSENLGTPEAPNWQMVAGAGLRTFNPGSLTAGGRRYVCRVTSAAGSLEAGENEVLVYNAVPSIVPGGWGLPATTVSAPYAFQVPLAGQGISEEAGGTGEFEADKTPVSFRAVGLPAGLQINAQGVISGRATVDGTFNVTITASNAVGSSSFGPTPLVVNGLSENVIGEFVGPVDRDAMLNGNLGGAISVRTTKRGTYTGSVTLGARTFSFRGLLTPASGVAGGQVVISRGRALPPLTLTFALDAATGLIDRALSGITDGVNTVGFDGWRFRWVAVKGAPPPAQSLAGYYTLGLNLAPDLVGTVANEGIPQGAGYAGFTVNARTGRLVVAGRLADGSLFTTATFAGPGGEVMVFRTLYAANARGSVVGQFKIDGGADAESADDNTLAGGLSWWRPASPAAIQRVYRDGFEPIDLVAVGGRYLAPVATALNPRVMGLEATADGVGNAVIELTEGLVELALPVMTAAEANTAVFRVDERNRAVASDPANNPRAVTLSINAKTGAFSGQFVLNEAHPFPGQKPDPIIRRVSYQGLIVTGGAEPIGVGYFLLPKLPGSATEKPTATPVLSGRVVFGKP